MRLKLLVVAVGLLTCAASAASADVRVTIGNGRVSIVASNATLRQILEEWARVGQTKIVNVERVSGAPMTIELTNVPEDQALDILLRPVTGFMAGQRPERVMALSRFDRIVLIPGVAAPRAPVSAAAAAPAATPTFAQPAPPPFPAEDEEERPGPRQPVFNTFPQPTVVYPGNAAQPIVNPQMGPYQQPVVQGGQPIVQQPSAVPTASPYGGVAVPGMIVAPPQQQPGMPGVVPPAPGTPQTKRPGGQ
ncbi:MAG TPA: hypothetical protein VL309_02885 [Vicinamibacterales bacterium]|nr:hypothetical protein [Vicinamibacterales bacterium]